MDTVPPELPPPVGFSSDEKRPLKKALACGWGSLLPRPEHKQKPRSNSERGLSGDRHIPHPDEIQVCKRDVLLTPG